ncbi:MAG: 1,2-phenylacetyl-CoA epoxidase, subunit B [Chlorobi bacterium OLB5]|nr:MAG: 1,2-phenylacetyl-CoA epoxidase, subunit B [Chlorobi bacterium OLB5]
MKSIDPRINRLELPANDDGKKILEELEQWETYEVFHQKKRGEQHVHCGIVHAATPEMALILAKEQYARRRQTSNLWVVKTKDVTATAYDDIDIFATTPEKTYREASDYYCMDRIRKYQQEHGIKDRKEDRRKKKESA